MGPTLLPLALESFAYSIICHHIVVCGELPPSIMVLVSLCSAYCILGSCVHVPLLLCVCITQVGDTGYQTFCLVSAFMQFGPTLRSLALARFAYAIICHHIVVCGELPPSIVVLVSLCSVYCILGSCVHVPSLLCVCITQVGAPQRRFFCLKVATLALQLQVFAPLF